MSSELKTKVSTESKTYTGRELSPHYLLREFGLRGSAIAAFMGPCHVSLEHLVDWEDRLSPQAKEAEIHAERMVHFLGEFFGITLREGVLLQRLFIATAKDVLEEFGVPQARIMRDGDDLFVGDAGFERKLSVSIVTASPVSVLFHAALNIDPSGAPVAAIGLNELKIPAEGPTGFAAQVLQRFATEWASLDWACAKVRPVVE